MVSCKKPLKNMEDYYPKVQTVSAEVQNDGSVIVTGDIVDAGAADVENWGFCMSTGPKPEMADSQHLGTSLFKTLYKGFSQDSSYSFRAWAYNSYGYSYGNIITLNRVVVSPITPPCSMTKNTIKYTDSGSETFTSVYKPKQGTDGHWTITASNTYGSIDFEFGEKPVTREYTTIYNNNYIGWGEIYVSFNGVFNTGKLDPGSSVIVNKLTDTTWEVTVCSAPWYNGSVTLSTYFQCPL